MSPDQERAIDALIVADKLDAAADLYRTATGTALIGAKMYVYERAATLQSRQPTASTPIRLQPKAVGIVDPRPAAKSAQSKRRGGCGSAFWVGLIFAIVQLVRHAIDTHVFGGSTITQKPYYRELVAAIEHQPKFIAQLGEPITVRDADVSCAHIGESSPGVEYSECTIPVRAPRVTDASVRAQTQYGPHLFHTDLTLRAGDREITALYYPRR